MSHTSIASTRDYIPGRDKGDLTDPAQAASFTSDPLLEPITTSAMPKPMLPDPTPSDNPELFDKSTSHPNTHYHPDVKLSKKKRAKKLGVGYVAKPHGGAHGTGGVNAGGRTFSEHEKEAHERAERRDAAIGPASEEHEEEEEEETDEDDEAEQEEQSHKQHHENRITGTEKGQAPPTNKRHEEKQKDGEGDHSQDDKQKKDGQEGGDEQDKDKSDNPSLMQRATNVLSSAQQKATGVVSGVTSSVMSTAQSVPVVGALLSKVGLGAAKSDDKPEDDKAEGEADDKADDSGAQGEDQQKSEQSEQRQGKGRKQGQGQAGGDNDARSKVGGGKEAATEATQMSSGEGSTKEAATKQGDEVFGKQGARQDNNEGALDKSRSHAGQKHVDNMKAA